MKKILFTLCILTIAANSNGSGNIEISDGKLKVFSMSGAEELQLYCTGSDCFLWWLYGALYLGQGDIYFDEDQNMRWDDANDILYVDVVDANTLDINDVNAVMGNFVDLTVDDLVTCTRAIVDDVRITGSTVQSYTGNLVISSGTDITDFDTDALTNIGSVTAGLIDVDDLRLDGATISRTTAGSVVIDDDLDLNSHALAGVTDISGAGDLEIDASGDYIWVGNSFLPDGDNTRDLGAVGATDYRFRDLCLSRNLTDETNTLTVGNAKTAYDHSLIAGGDSVHVSTAENTAWDTAYSHSQVAGGDSVHVSTAENTAWDTAYGWGDHSTQNYLDDDVADDVDDLDIDWGSTGNQVDMDDLGDGSTNAAVTLTQETNWDTHLTSDGSDHTFVDQNVCVAGMPQLANLGIGTNAAATYGIRASKTIDSVTAFGLDMILYDERDGLCNFMKGLNFAAQFRPKTTQSANRNANAIYGSMGYAGIASQGSHAHDVTATNAYALYGYVSANKGGSHTGDVTLNGGHGLYIANGSTTGGATIPVLYGARIANQTAGAVNWAIYSEGGQSAHAGNLRIGDTTAPTYSLEVNGVISMLERSSDPAEPAEGQCIIWMSDGTGKGDDGDVLIASKAGAQTNWGTLFDHSGGAAW